MGADPKASDPIFFSKPAAAVSQQPELAWPERTGELHHEVELVVALGAGGRYLAAQEALGRICAWAVGVDLTRRDVQARAKAAGHPWEMSKGFDQSAPLGELLAADAWSPSPDRDIELSVNGDIRQRARLGDMIWDAGELLARLSAQVTLHAGDLVFTGTPAGVGPLAPGDRVLARIDGLPPLAFSLDRPGRDGKRD